MIKFISSICFLGFITLSGFLGTNQDKREATLKESEVVLKNRIVELENTVKEQINIIKIQEHRLEKFVYSSMDLQIPKIDTIVVEKKISFTIPLTSTESLSVYKFIDNRKRDSLIDFIKKNGKIVIKPGIKGDIK